jgi:hypothetical protein
LDLDEKDAKLSEIIMEIRNLRRLALSWPLSVKGIMPASEANVATLAKFASTKTELKGIIMEINDLRRIHPGVSIFCPGCSETRGHIRFSQTFQRTCD